jgi:hypothetical protein
MVAYSGCRGIGPARGGGKLRRKSPGRGKRGERQKKILNRGNEPKDLLEAKELAVFGAKNELFLNANELNFSPQKRQKTTFDAESKSRFASRKVWRVGKHKGAT